MVSKDVKAVSGIEWFDPSLGAPIVSLAAYGLTLNKAAVDMLQGSSRVMLGFDREASTIVVKPVEADDSKSFKFAPRDGYVRIASKDFVRFVARYCPRLRLDTTTRFLATWDEERGMMLVDLNRPVDGKPEDGSSQ